MSIFTQEQRKRIGTNKFNLTHDKKLTCGFGQLIPVQVQEVIPGDTFSLKTSVMVRFAPLIAPIMHQVDCIIDHFFVPYRLLWDGWEDFIAGDQNVYAKNSDWPEEHRVHPKYQYIIQEAQEGSLIDYFGGPTIGNLLNSDAEDCTFQINAFPFAAYSLIYHEYYRDEDLEIPASGFQKLVDGIQGQPPIQTPQRTAYSKDYFTSARPWPQKGSEAMLPVGDGKVSLVDDFQIYKQKVVNTAGGTPSSGTLNSNAAGEVIRGNAAWIDPNGSWTVNFSEASIVNLRRAIALQEFLETRARFGSRYQEHIYGQYGVMSSDKRLQRPELIGSQKTPIKISEVLNTTGQVKDESSTTTLDPLPQGNMAGHGIGYGTAGFKKYYAEEFGLIMSLMRIKPRAAYVNAVPRYLLKDDPFDYAVPKFAHIGEQAIWAGEVAVDAMACETNKDTWGYQMRYAEYKSAFNTVHGQFRTTMDYWHMGRKFLNNRPELNSTFIKVNESSNDFSRIFAVNPVQNNVDPLWCQVLNETIAKRKLPFFGNPKIV